MLIEGTYAGLKPQILKFQKQASRTKHYKWFFPHYTSPLTSNAWVYEIVSYPSYYYHASPLALLIPNGGMGPHPTPTWCYNNCLNERKVGHSRPKNNNYVEQGVTKVSEANILGT